MPVQPIPSPDSKTNSSSSENTTTESSSEAAKAKDAERHQRIAEEAYRIAERSGFPLNSDQAHWYEAERRIEANAASA